MHANLWQKDFAEKGIIKIVEKTAWTIGTCELDPGIGLVKNWGIVQKFGKSHAGWRKSMGDFVIMLNGKQEENDFHHGPFEVILTTFCLLHILLHMGLLIVRMKTRVKVTVN